MLTKIYFLSQLAIGAICCDILYQLCENVCLLNFRRVTGMIDLGEYWSLDADNLASAVYLSPVQTPKPSNDGSILCLLELESD